MENKTEFRVDTEGENKKNLIVNYLPQTLADDDFFSLFQNIGPVRKAKIVRDKVTGYSYGFGFVEFVHDIDAQRAVESLNGMQLENKRIKVAYSREGGDVKGANLYIRNLPKNFTEENLKQLFSKYGSIVQSRVLTDNQTKESKCIAFVLFGKKSHAEVAMKELDNICLPGSTTRLQIKFADDSSRKVRPPPGSRHQSYQRFSHDYYYGHYPPDCYSPRYAQDNYPSRYSSNPYSPRYSQDHYPSRYDSFDMSYNNLPYTRSNGQHWVPNGSKGNYMEGNPEGGETATLFVYNIGSNTTERELWDLFSGYRTVQKCNVIWDSQKNQCKGYGFVTLGSWGEATLAIKEMHGYYYKNGPLSVSFKK
ncbi:hypothetical protein ACJMK2_040409 [Sinanodonta woodiana]|uniref:RRM domain-containing protein n=1 Tax=Sinanodonta woodiana TaxID=1069815 RepID=A0ABD3WF45_SINWO